MTTFTAADVPDLTGRTAIVTGANSGVGLATTRALAAAGAHVVLAVRDVGKGRAAAEHLPGTTEVRALDLADLASVRDFAAHWEGPVDLLVNNAAAPPPSELRHTADGFELQFGTGHLGHFALTTLLLEHLTGRVVTVASQAERFARLDLAGLDALEAMNRGPRPGDPATATPYRSSRVYGQVKLANLLFTAELQRRLTAAGSDVRAHAAHPGYVDTAIYRENGPVSRVMVRLLAQSPEQGALPVLFAAVADLPGNSFTGPRHLAHMRGSAEPIPRSAAAQDAELARRLWTMSERLTGVAWPAGSARTGSPA
ncbi:putative dehydrogenase [Actinacidiphila reveromycinica]|uniref:Putative dehydrogenase n=1 Tax=Actinacidiphila reveromycinica TaxID=659352 RepID=A0A7U3VR39_9ACTN|nr:SDR family NAD(P)-dependent oxidoreductase [Streptomyces sp. SN-593]BBB00295.1 putative dehydrogenase [Streptomyces sp. SN-593]